VLGMAWLRTKPVLGGAALALACAIKYVPLAFLPYLLVRRQWKAAGGMTAGLLACALLPALWLGWNRNLEYLAIALRGMGVMSGASSAATASSGSKPAANVIPIDAEYSLSITSGIARMLGPDRSFASLAIWTCAALVAAVCIAWLLYRVKGIGLFTLSTSLSRDFTPSTDKDHASTTPDLSESWSEDPGRATKTSTSSATPSTRAHSNAHHNALLNALPLLWFAECSAVLAAALAFAPQTQKRHFNILVPLVAGLVVVAGRIPGGAIKVSIASLLIFAAGVTPMLNVPGTRAFVDNVWKWSGGPGWLAIAAAYALVWLALSRSKVSRASNP
jgi:Glycosyltransferase family 87